MTIQVIDVETMQKFSADEVQPIVLHQSEGLVALLLCLDPGQVVGPCVMSARILYLVMAGSGQLNVADEQAGLKTGSVVIVPAGVVRSIVAAERMRLLAVQVP
jgi:quercetin dioxygenase-like cupin family protein